LWGVIHGIHYFVPIMLKQNTECHIVNTASSLGVTSFPYNNPYAVSKHAVVVLSETLYLELADKTKNIGVSVLIPGYVKTHAMDGERNRPRELTNQPGEGIDTTKSQYRAMMESYRQGVDTGMQPEKVAEIVFDAIGNKKLYIFANNEMIKPMIRRRMENILQEQNPTPFT
jgi:short-subunit dehydrogenase